MLRAEQMQRIREMESEEKEMWGRERRKLRRTQDMEKAKRN
jgi:hypothetical protein